MGVLQWSGEGGRVGVLSQLSGGGRVGVSPRLGRGGWWTLGSISRAVSARRSHDDESEKRGRAAQGRSAAAAVVAAVAAAATAGAELALDTSDKNHHCSQRQRSKTSL